jgi:hypothetical protein
MFVTPQDAEGGDVEVKRYGCLDVEIHPGDGNGTEEVAVRERKNPAVAAGRECDEVRSPRIDLRRRLAAWGSVFEKLPDGSRFVDRLRGYALVIAVLDLAQQRRQLRVGEARDRGGETGALKRARVHRVEVDCLEAIAQSGGLLFAMSCER